MCQDQFYKVLVDSFVLGIIKVMSFLSYFTPNIRDFSFRSTHTKALHLRIILYGITYLLLWLLNIVPLTIIFVFFILQIPLIYLFHIIQKKWSIFDPGLTIFTFLLDDLIAVYIIHQAGLVGLIFLIIIVFQVVIISILDYFQIAFLVAFLVNLIFFLTIYSEDIGLIPAGSFFFLLGTNPYKLGVVVAFINFISALAPGLISEELKAKSKKHWGVIYDKKFKKPLPLAIVRLFGQDGRLKETVVTDDDGRYSFLVEPGKYILEINKEGFKNQKLTDVEVYGKKGGYIGQDVYLEKN